MENIINVILEMDKKSREMKEQAEQEKANMSTVIAERKKYLYEQYDKSLNAIVQMTEEEQQEICEQRKKKIDEDAKTSMSKLESTYSAHCDEWVKKIVGEVTGE